MTPPAQARIERTATISDRVAALDWNGIAQTLDAQGVVTTGPLLSAQDCADMRAVYDHEETFRSHIIMGRHGFGRGEYKYFQYPLPDLVEQLRVSLYPRLAPIANAWTAMLSGGSGSAAAPSTFPAELTAYIDLCHEAGQTRPTPLLLKYVAGDYNCLHQDLYGAHVFPLQVAIVLSDPRSDFDGGEFVVVEQRPRMQSRAEVVIPSLGEAVIFAVHHRPVQGSKGPYRVNLRHGVSRIRSGQRLTLGVIFHDAL